MTGSFQTVHKTGHYQAIYATGRKTVSRYMVVYVLPNLIDQNQYGIVASKKIGGAVRRNKAKRRIREVIRKHLPAIRPGYDLVIVARSGLIEAPYQDVLADFQKAIKRAGIV